MRHGDLTIFGGLIINLCIHGVKQKTDPWIITVINKVFIWIYNRLIVHVITEVLLVIGIVSMIVIFYYIWKYRLTEISERRKFFEENNGLENFNKDKDSWGCFLNTISNIYGIELHNANIEPPIENHKYGFLAKFCGVLCCINIKNKATKTTTTTMVIENQSVSTLL